MPILLEKLRKGNPDIDVTILIATGFHRPTTREEMIFKFGEKIVEEERIITHIPENSVGDPVCFNM